MGRMVCNYSQGLFVSEKTQQSIQFHSVNICVLQIEACKEQDFRSSWLQSHNCRRNVQLLCTGIHVGDHRCSAAEISGRHISKSADIILPDPD